jgi:hypothetical protein
MKRLVVGVALAAAVALPAERAAAMSPAECAELSIHLKNLPEASSARCGGENFGGGDQGSGRQEYIQIMAGDSLFVVSHTSAGVRTYLRRLGVKDIIGNYPVFASTENWGEETDSSDFALRRFDAKLTGTGAKVLCVGFVHFSGHVARSTGYRHVISGYDCSFGATPPTDARMDQLVSSIGYDFE